MIPTKLSSKGQLTIPKQFRQRMRLTELRRVLVEQKANGAVVIHPVPSILQLAGTLKLKKPMLPLEEERRTLHAAMARKIAANPRAR